MNERAIALKISRSMEGGNSAYSNLEGDIIEIMDGAKSKIGDLIGKVIQNGGEYKTATTIIDRVVSRWTRGYKVW